jgi:hypothetical protein
MRRSALVALLVIASVLGVGVSHAAHACSIGSSRAGHCTHSHDHGAKAPACCRQEPATALASRLESGMERVDERLVLAPAALRLPVALPPLSEKNADRQPATDHVRTIRLHLLLSTLIV